MAYRLGWVPGVLRAAGLTVIEHPGWETRGHGDMGEVLGVIGHHDASADTGPLPSLPVLINGRSDLAGPLCNLGLGRDGVFHMIAAGRAYHAGAGEWRGCRNGNSQFIGIEAANRGDGYEPWPDVELDAYFAGVAALLTHIGADAMMFAGHKEYALPKGRKIDPSFDMSDARARVSFDMAGLPWIEKPALEHPARAMLGRGSRGPSVEQWQRAIGMQLTAGQWGIFGPKTEAATVAWQTAHAIGIDGKVGPESWASVGIGDGRGLPR